MKKRITLLLALFLFIFSITNVIASDLNVNIIIDGKIIRSDTSPIMLNNRLLVPIRVISENLGYEVSWSQELKEVTIVNNDSNIKLAIDQRTLWKNGTATDLDVAPILYNDRTMLPLRAVSESLGALIKWDNINKVAYIYTNIGDKINIGQEDQTTNPTSDQGSNSDEIVDNENSDTTNQSGDQANDNETTNGNQGSDSANQDNGELVNNLALLTKILQKGSSITFTFEGTIESPSFVRTSNPEQLLIFFDNTLLSDELLIPDIENKDLIDKIEFEQNAFQKAIVKISLNKDAKYTSVKFSNSLGVYLVANTSPYTTINEKPLVTKKVIIDAGHGGKDPGATGPGGHREKDLNLAVALKVNELLKSVPEIEGILSRDADYFVPLDDRVDFANNAKADIFVSIHTNALPGQPTISGTETYYISSEGYKLAKIIHRHLLQGTGFNDRGIRTADYRVIKNTSMPAILLEMGYITNAADEKKMFTEEFKQEVAEEIVEGIKEYFNVQ